VVTASHGAGPQTVAPQREPFLSSASPAGGRERRRVAAARAQLTRSDPTTNLPPRRTPHQAFTSYRDARLSASLGVVARYASTSRGDLLGATQVFLEVVYHFDCPVLRLTSDRQVHGSIVGFEVPIIESRVTNSTSSSSLQSSVPAGRIGSTM
jgi:hypothetical protein